MVNTIFGGSFQTVLALMLFVLASCTNPLRSDVQPEEFGAQVLATVSARSDGRWRVRYVFDRPHAALFFNRSFGDYRASTWKPVTRGVSLVRLDGFDAVLMKTPMTVIEFLFTPYTQTISKDYTPFIPFSDGGLALYTGQFELLSETDRASIAALHGDIDRWKGEQPMFAVRVLSDKPMVHNGEIRRREAVQVSRGDGTYIYVGEASLMEGADLTGVIDPGLPGWLRERVEPELGAIFDANRTLWGDGLSQKATVLFAFRGFEGEGMFNTGGAVNSLLALESSGEDLRHFHEDTLIFFRWFFAHEVVHLFQNRHGASIDSRSAAWMTEGAANAMAISVLREIGVTDDEFVLGQYGEAIDKCSEYLGDGPLIEAAQRGQFDAFYTCGDLIAQMTDAALADDDLFSFWNALLVRGAEAEQHLYSTADYFDVLRERGAKGSVIELLRALVYEQQADPEKTLLRAMHTTGLAPRFDDDGKLVEIFLPGNGTISREARDH